MSARPSTRWLIWNVVSVNLGWFGCVLSAAHGQPWLGPALIAVLVAIHLTRVDARRRESLTLVSAAAVGYALDSALVLAGAFDFPPAAVVGAPTTVWMVALWVNFATAINGALYWLGGRPWLAAALGLIGGPMAYYGGVRLGALLLPHGSGYMLALVALEWLVATPLLIAGAARIGRRVAQPVSAEVTA
ncbi:MAG: DUF2878 domain-containing protein [Halofilum sp. (in: g-proteobacteria)]